jgi:KDO2-lipid IV(A) lauroyltransferase
VNKVKRGFYEFELKLITENPCETEYGYITQTCVENLEKDINSQPEFWLWSHNRWKNKKKS